jgi:nucleoid-associated protein EbfC
LAGNSNSRAKEFNGVVARELACKARRILFYWIPFPFQRTTPSQGIRFMPGVGKLLKQAQKMQKKMEELTHELSLKELEVSAGGGAVVVKISLQQELKSIKIDPEFLKEDAKVVEDTITEAVRSALEKSRKESQDAMSGITAGISLPGLM